MNKIKKISAIVCALALIVSSIVYYPAVDAKAVDYSTLTYTTLGGDISYCKLSDGLIGMSPTSPELLDAGVTLQFAYSADNTNVKASLNGVNVTTSDNRVTTLTNSIAKFNPQNFEADSYTLITLTSDQGVTEYVIKRGNPTSGGEVPSQGDEESSSQGGEESSNQGGEATTTNPATTAPVVTTPSATVPDATSLPKQLYGLDVSATSGAYTIDNAVLFAWAGADDPLNAAGYDPTVTSTVIYIYKDGALLTKIANATKGGIVGGLSAGTYTAQAANVNSMGEGPLSETKTFTVTGTELHYTYPINCIGPKTPCGFNIITGNPEVPADNPAQDDNKLGVSWASSNTDNIPSTDMSVVGYNVYIFNAETGMPYRRVYVDGIATNTIIMESVSAGKYLVCLSAVNAEGEESALASPSFGMSSVVTVKGQVIDNAQEFEKPNQPTLPIGLEIITQGIDYGFTVAWSADADLTGIKLNLYVNGHCIKSGINDGTVSSYYENRLAAGTYTVEIKAQYISNNVESFPLTKEITIAADPGLTTATPEQLADPNYSEYEEPSTEPVDPPTDPVDPPTDPVEPPTDPVEPPTDPVEPPSGDTTTPSVIEPNTTTQPTTQKPTTVAPTTTKKVIAPARAKVRKATKKKAAKKLKISVKRVKGARGYRVEISKKKNFKKKIYKKTVNKINFTVTSKKFKNAKLLYVRVKAYKLNGKKKVWSKKWSVAKKVRIN